jgi:hypothetical protein
VYPSATAPKPPSSLPGLPVVLALAHAVALVACGPDTVTAQALELAGNASALLVHLGCGAALLEHRGSRGRGSRGRGATAGAAVHGKGGKDKGGVGKGGQQGKGAAV